MTIFTPGTRVTVKRWALSYHRHGVVVNPPDILPDGPSVLVAFPDCDIWPDGLCENTFREAELEVEP